MPESINRPESVPNTQNAGINISILQTKNMKLGKVK